MLHISIVYIVVVESLLLLFKDTGPVAEPFVEFIFVGKKLVSQFAIVLSDVDLDFVSGAVVQDDEFLEECGLLRIGVILNGTRLLDISKQVSHGRG